LGYIFSSLLDGIRIGASRKQGHHDDLDIEQERPIIYVVQIALDAPPHLLDRISFSASEKFPSIEWAVAKLVQRVRRGFVLPKYNLQIKRFNIFNQALAICA
jgi:hypothetical protein